MAHWLLGHGARWAFAMGVRVAGKGTMTPCACAKPAGGHQAAVDGHPDRKPPHRQGSVRQDPLQVSIGALANTSWLVIRSLAPGPTQLATLTAASPNEGVVPLWSNETALCTQRCLRDEHCSAHASLCRGRVLQTRSFRDDTGSCPLRQLTKSDTGSLTLAGANGGS